MKKLLYIFTFFALLTCLNAEDKGLYIFEQDKNREIPRIVTLLSKKVNSYLNKKDWDNLLLHSLPKIQEKAHNYSSVADFFKTQLPEEIFGDRNITAVIFIDRIKIKNKLKKVFYFSFFQQKTKTLMWKIKIIKKDDKLYLDFPIIKDRCCKGTASSKCGKLKSA